MGHNRVSVLPDTAPWREVVGLVADDADLSCVAAATTEAASKGLDLARNDAGVHFPLLLLVKVVQAARTDDFAESLRDAGIAVDDQPDAFDLSSGFHQAIDRRLDRVGRSDVGEMAQLAAVESLSALLAQRSANLYDTTPTDIQKTVKSFSTESGFATLAHEFYAQFTQRFLTYHLGREIGLHVGSNGRFVDTDGHSEFIDRLKTHCREASVIAQTYAGNWYSKQTFQGGIDDSKARQFVRHCLDKLRRELIKRGTRNG
jgi:hypothetical protein